ncbi:MAG: copper-binding protein [Rhodothermales bacterium]
MNRSVRLAVVFTVLLMLSSCAQRAQEIPEPAEEVTPASVKTYQAIGVIKAFLPDGEHIRIAHEEIPGFMEAMTMSFAVEDTILLQGIQVEDSVRFTLTVTGDDIAVSALARVE